MYTQNVLFYSMVLKEIEYFHFFFSTVKMAVKYGEIGRLGKLEAGFQQVPLVQTF